MARGEFTAEEATEMLKVVTELSDWLPKNSNFSQHISDLFLFINSAKDFLSLRQKKVSEISFGQVTRTKEEVDSQFWHDYVIASVKAGKVMRPLEGDYYKDLASQIGNLTDALLEEYRQRWA